MTQDEANREANKTMHFFFKSMGVGFCILCVKSAVIGGASIVVVKNLWYSFLYNFMISIWLGLSSMFGIDIYSYIKKKYKK